MSIDILFFTPQVPRVSMANDKPGRPWLSGTGRPERKWSVQTASAEQLTALQPFLYKPILFHLIPFSPPCFMIFSPFIHDTRDNLWHRDIFVTSCWDTCGTEAKTQALRGRNSRKSCSVLAKMSSMDSLTSPWLWTGIHISREDHADLITENLFECWDLYLNI